MQKKPDLLKKLLKWHQHQNSRQMPWKGEKDPYRIWLSEVILQQTRVEQGWAYYEKFRSSISHSTRPWLPRPNNSYLNSGKDLGYYNRCRNLMATAKRIDSEY
jgi:A/G-specific adenine glycosylase